jgi:hypothetical protein
MTANFTELLPLLVNHEVDFIVIGGGAAIAHESARLTSDVGVPILEKPNIQRLSEALKNHNLTCAVPRLAFLFDKRTIRAGLNFWKSWQSFRLCAKAAGWRCDTVRT